jgi:hypothetical protein
MKTLVTITAIVLISSAQAQTPAATPKIYSCVGADGKAYKSDKLNPECLDTGQKELNADGSSRRIVPRRKTPDEEAEEAEKQRQLERDQKARQAEVRADQLLLTRYPNQAAHDKARKEALDSAQGSIANAQARLKLLEVDQKKLADESEFYVGKAPPAKLKNAVDANDAARAAQASIIADRQQEIGRINKLFDDQLEHLKKLLDIQKKATSRAP